MLGSSAGGALLYVEPGAVVPTNNELAAARGEAYAAEEAVLSQLSMRCAAQAASLQAVLDQLVWLDVAVAKAEYGLWTGGHLSREGVWPHEQPAGVVPEGEEGPPLVFRLKQLRCVRGQTKCHVACVVKQCCIVFLHVMCVLNDHTPACDCSTLVDSSTNSGPASARPSGTHCCWQRTCGTSSSGGACRVHRRLGGD